MTADPNAPNDPNAAASAMPADLDAGLEADDLGEEPAELAPAEGAEDALRAAHDDSVPLVAVGASAGGLEAFKRFFRFMPASPGLSFLVVQHLDPNHKSILTEILAQQTSMRVYEAEEGVVPVRNTVYVIPTGCSLELVNGVLHLTRFSEEALTRANIIDRCFDSVAEARGPGAMCVLLSGTGSDGSRGMKKAKSAGGLTIAQALDDAQYPAMPESAIANGAATAVMPIEDIPSALMRYALGGTPPPLHAQSAAQESVPLELDTIIALLREQLDHDFSNYKPTTLLRRIRHRMNLCQVESLKDYCDFLVDRPGEANALFEELLIGVTQFFRDTECWEALETNLIEPIVDARSPGDTLRIWVPGCSTGEEAYGIAMVAREVIEKKRKRLRLQVFASDIDTAALNVARHASYPSKCLADIPERFHDKYIEEDYEHIRIRATLRDDLVFSAQNVISDPPFSKIDLVSCRNLLIYLTSEMQRRLIVMFHFALREDGGLMLGNSENIEMRSDLFQPVAKPYRLFRRLDAVRRDSIGMRFGGRTALRPGTSDIQTHAGISRPRLGSLVEQGLLAKLDATAVLVNAAREVLYHYGRTERYLELPRGTASNDILVLARSNLDLHLRNAIMRAARGGKPVEDVRGLLHREGGTDPVLIDVLPLNHLKGGDGLFLVCFRHDEAGVEEGADGEVIEGKVVATPAVDSHRVRVLEQELEIARQELQNTVEELGTANEELRLANEEALSVNEELQSTNEELETSKEEMQSLNEELNTVNAELQGKVLSLESANNDLTNLINSTRTASVFLDNRLRVKFFTPSAKSLFALIGSDLGRPLQDITPRFDDPELWNEARTVLRHGDTLRRRIQSDASEWYERRILPYRTVDNRSEGVVITFENITEALEELAPEALPGSGLQGDLISRAPIGIVAFTREGRIMRMSPKAESMLGTRGRNCEGEDIGTVIGCHTLSPTPPRWDCCSLKESDKGHCPLARAIQSGDELGKEGATLNLNCANQINGEPLNVKAQLVSLDEQSYALYLSEST